MKTTDPVDLGELETQLNNDEEVRTAFMSDPVGVLEDRGLRLSSKMQDSLRRYVDELQNPAKSAAGASTSDDGVIISIGKSF